ncbi:MAG: GAF domain-containing protein [Sphaerochaetaceae bacterium]
MFEPYAKTGERSLDEQEFLERLGSLLEPSLGKTSLWITSLANASALLFWYLDRVNWVGFYIRDTDSAKGMDRLVLGPFQGLPACTSIGYGQGVCGTCWATGQTQRVADVHAFPGHIACDGSSRSEVVVPVVIDGTVVAVLDIDSPELDRFSTQDVAFLQMVGQLIASVW